MLKNEKGFTGLEGLLLLVTLVAIGFVGWFVWHAKATTSKTYDDASKTAVLTAGSTTMYTNKEFGFTFKVPKGLGSASQVSVAQDTLAQSKTGKAYQVSMPTSKLAAGFVTKDWLPVGNAAVPGFTTYDACKANGSKNVVTLYSDATTCVVIYGAVINNSALGGGDNDKMAVLEAEKAFTHNQTTAGLQFLQQGVVVSDFTAATLTKAFDSLSGDMTTLVKSIVEL